MKLPACLLLASILASTVLASDAPPPPAASLKTALENAAAKLPAGGIVSAEIDGANVSYSTFGKLAAPAGVAPERVLFEIGSITKFFTGLLLAQATLDGKVSLDDPITKYLPPDLSLHPNVAAITLRQLSTHTSGLPRLPDNLHPLVPADPYANYLEPQLYDFLGSFKPAKTPPQAADYSNLGAGLLGHLLERAYGVSYAELVRTKITDPLAMNDTTIALTDDQKARFAVPHSGSVAVLPWNLGVLSGAGALRSTAADLAKFAQALCDEHSPIAAAWKIAREPRAPMGPRGQIGLGIFISERDGRTVYSHGGGTGGFRSHLEFTPATRTALVVLLNNDDPDPAALAAAAHRPPTDASAAKSAPTPEVAISADELRKFTGVYAIDARARFTVVLDEQGQLRIRLTGQAFLPVSYLGGDRFAAKAVAAQFQFARSADGKVTSVTLHQNGREIPASRTADAPVVNFLPVEKLREYAGTYELVPGTVFEVGVGQRTTTLTVKLTGQPTFPVHNTKPDHFVYDIVDAALTFERGADGRVVAVVLHQNGADQRAPKQAGK